MNLLLTCFGMDFQRGLRSLRCGGSAIFYGAEAAHVGKMGTGNEP